MYVAGLLNVSCSTALTATQEYASAVVGTVPLSSLRPIKPCPMTTFQPKVAALVRLLIDLLGRPHNGTAQSESCNARKQLWV